MMRPRRMNQALGAKARAGCACGGKCGCGPNCPCRANKGALGGLGGANTQKFDQMLAAYEQWSHRVNPDFGRAVTTIINAHYRPAAGGNIIVRDRRLKGFGDTYDSSYSGAIYSGSGIEPFYSPSDITPVSEPSQDLLNNIYDPSNNVITITAATNPTAEAVTVGPAPDLTPAAPSVVTPIDWDAIAQQLSNIVPPGKTPLQVVSGALSSLASAAKKALGPAAAPAAGGAAALQKQAQQASMLSLLLVGLAIFVIGELFSNG